MFRRAASALRASSANEGFPLRAERPERSRRGRCHSFSKVKTIRLGLHEVMRASRREPVGVAAIAVAHRNFFVAGLRV